MYATLLDPHVAVLSNLSPTKGPARTVEPSRRSAVDESCLRIRTRRLCGRTKGAIGRQAARIRPSTRLNWSVRNDPPCALAFQLALTLSRDLTLRPGHSDLCVDRRWAQ